MSTELILLIILVLLFALILHIRPPMQLVATAKFGGGHKKKDKLLRHVHKQQSPHLGDISAVVLRDSTNEVIQHADTIVDFSQIKYSIPYIPSDTLVKTTVHNGQLKLFLTELEFLTYVLPKNDTKCIVVYAGSSPSHKLSFLADMFPNVKFVCVDPNEHLVMFDQTDQYSGKHIDKFLYFAVADGNRFSIPSRKINMYGIGRVDRSAQKNVPDNLADVILSTDHTYYMIEDYLDDNLSKKLAPLANGGLPFYFISDIRSRYEKADMPTTVDILWNSAMMYNWLAIMRPQKFMLKFHPPYTITDKSLDYFEKELAASPWTKDAFDSCPIPFVENYRKRNFAYIAGEAIWIQAFAGQSSSETRLIGSSLETKDYDLLDYENKFFYFNKIHRPYGWHTDHEACLSQKIGIDRCGDCALMCKIFADYYKKYFGNVDGDKIKSDVANLLNVIQRSIKNPSTFHGKYFTQFVNASAIISYQECLLLAESANKYYSQNIFNIADVVKQRLKTHKAIYEFLSKKYEKRVINTCMNSINTLSYIKESFPLAWSAFFIQCSRWLSKTELQELKENITKIKSGENDDINTIENIASNMPIDGPKWIKLYEDLRSRYEKITIITSIVPEAYIYSNGASVKYFSSEAIKHYPENHLIILRIVYTPQPVIECAMRALKEHGCSVIIVRKNVTNIPYLSFSNTVDRFEVVDNISTKVPGQLFEIGYINIQD